MTQDPLTPSVSERICKHMNLDHEDALKFYAIHYGKAINPINAKMIEITNTHMKILVDKNILTIEFDHVLLDSQDAHKTLKMMIKKNE